MFLNEFLSALTSEAFLQNAMLGGLFAGIVCGVIGPFVYVRQFGNIVGAIAHTVLGGMGIAFYLGKSPILGALISAVLTAFLVGWVSLYHREREDSIINAMWAAGVAIGIIFIFKTPGYDVQLLSYLFGNILMVTDQDLTTMGILGSVIILLVAVFYRKFLAISFDEHFTRLRGVNVKFYYFLLLTLIAVTTVLLVQIVGLVLVITLFILPAATAAQFYRSLVMIIVGAIVGGVTFTELGIFLSYQWNLPAGATIILLFTTIYLLVIAVKKVVKKN